MSSYYVVSSDVGFIGAIWGEAVKVQQVECGIDGVPTGKKSTGQLFHKTSTPQNGQDVELDETEYAWLEALQVGGKKWCSITPAKKRRGFGLISRIHNTYVERFANIDAFINNITFELQRVFTAINKLKAINKHERYGLLSTWEGGVWRCFSDAQVARGDTPEMVYFANDCLRADFQWGPERPNQKYFTSDDRSILFEPGYPIKTFSTKAELIAEVEKQNANRLAEILLKVI